MSSSPTILSCYTNGTVSILELKMPQQQQGEVSHWLFHDRSTAMSIKLWERTRDFAPDVSEYFFEQGYLKIRGKQAVFIEKYNIGQYVMDYVLPSCYHQQIAGQYLGFESSAATGPIDGELA